MEVSVLVSESWGLVENPGLAPIVGQEPLPDILDPNVLVAALGYDYHLHLTTNITIAGV